MTFLDSSFVVISIFLVTETIAIVKLIENIKKNKEIKPIEVKKIIDLVDGPCAIQGKIVALEPLLISPYRKEECVYYNFRVDQRMRTGRGINWWDSLIDDEKFTCAGIDDGTGVVKIDLKKAEFHIGKRFEFETGRFKFPNQYQQDVMSKYTLKKRSFVLALAMQMKFKEVIIEEGMEVYMQAEAKYSVDERLIFKDAENIIISKPGKSSLIAQYRTNIFLSILGIIGGIVLLIIAL